ncbi:hypothetical protein SAMD00023353_2300640 [Rosellinia necatrix]|uniref:Uncharacterized protein n=1 Tax=Rosellinia necatrix TaxID=77044 RepID=A0A1S8A7T8_ROSNE|nr:hypothetical protein SAMD00023353_2300640 [Rosellinia necatrix]
MQAGREYAQGQADGGKTKRRRAARSLIWDNLDQFGDLWLWNNRQERSRVGYGVSCIFDSLVLANVLFSRRSLHAQTAVAILLPRVGGCAVYRDSLDNNS